MSAATIDRDILPAIFLTTMAVAAVAWLGVWGWSKSAVDHQSSLLASPYLKLSVTEGHGSGVYIGNGNIITAAHVVTGESSITAETDQGAKATATVLWANQTYDVALLHVDSLAAAPASLDCRPTFNSERIKAYGNPLDLDFVFTQGSVSGKPREVGPWKVAVPVDMTIIPGQSGGAVVNDDGQIVGIAVGVPTEQGAPVAYGIIVPAETICMLMGRQ